MVELVGGDSVDKYDSEDDEMVELVGGDSVDKYDSEDDDIVELVGGDSVDKYDSTDDDFVELGAGDSVDKFNTEDDDIVELKVGVGERHFETVSDKGSCLRGSDSSIKSGFDCEENGGGRRVGSLEDVAKEEVQAEVDVVDENEVQVAENGEEDKKKGEVCENHDKASKKKGCPLEESEKIISPGFPSDNGSTLRKSTSLKSCFDGEEAKRKENGVVGDEDVGNGQNVDECNRRKRVREDEIGESKIDCAAVHIHKRIKGKSAVLAAIRSKKKYAAVANVVDKCNRRKHVAVERNKRESASSSADVDGHNKSKSDAAVCDVDERDKPKSDDATAGDVDTVNRKNFDAATAEVDERNEKKSDAAEVDERSISKTDAATAADIDEHGKGKSVAAPSDNDGVGGDDEGEAGIKEKGGKTEGNLQREVMKAKYVCAPEAEPVFKFFVNGIWETDENLQNQESDVLNDDEEPILILRKFNYGVEKPEPKEKSIDEKIIESWWNEFDFALASLDVGSFGASTPAVDTEDVDESNDEGDPHFFCPRGNHNLYLNDEVGIKCRYCPFVQLEIKYILPAIDTSRSERIPKKKTYTSEDEFSMWEAFHDADGNSPGSSVHGNGTVWNIFPQIRKNMFLHQQEGFEFLWTNVAGGNEIDVVRKSLHNDNIGGCMISHAPGTGKTFLTIAFLRSYMEVFKECRPVIMAPACMLLTWEEEFKKWGVDIPFHNFNSLELTGKEDEVACRMIQAGRTHNQKMIRLAKLFSWSRERSILGISYSLFEKHAGERSVTGKGKKKQREIPYANKDEEIQAKEMRRILLEKPSLVILDEGHTPRNSRSQIWKALGNIKTGKRIILSGTPFQNNFDELYNTLCLVRPQFAERFTTNQTSSHTRQNARGVWTSLTSTIGKDIGKDLLEEIRSLIDPFVHVHRGSILKESLPGLRSCVVVLRPLPLQKEILEGLKNIQKIFLLEHCVSCVSIHPSLLISCGSSSYENSSIDEVQEEQPGIQHTKNSKSGRRGKLAIQENNELLRRYTKETIDQIKSDDFRLDPDQGVKTRFLMELIRLCEVLKEKVLVFCQYKYPFVLIKGQLKRHFNWTEGEEVLQIVGEDTMRQRQSVINVFNNPDSKVRVLLATIGTCSEGINLIGASRVVLLDVLWNPSVERQAISRAYRIGQKKVVYTYHLITYGTMEEDKYDRQVHKDLLSELVFHGDKEEDPSIIRDDKILEEMVGNKELRSIFKQIHVPAEPDA
ncbi:Dna repair and recombination protein rad54-like [Thalictrum thalictroides]|uniref:Dna repair and recombination protein rad54-like n=1 Tax=Thalictrum thalictroides TaxID=46969 RepID=A0A7J6UVQ4_THATH|nr:Dna repair and recombination protein rad54-like [Thalictrum thalictroides]